jgi:hypothetical protein
MPTAARACTTRGSACSTRFITAPTGALRRRQGAAVFGLPRHEPLALAFERHVGGHLLVAQLVLAAHQRRLAFQLRLQDLPLLLFHRDVRVQLVFADRAFLFTADMRRA